MQVLSSKRVRWLLALLFTVGLAGLVTTQAQAGVVSNVTVSEGPGWVKVNVHGSGFSYNVKHLPPGTEDYRSIVLDVSPAVLPAGMEPKSSLPVNEGLVAQVRVRQYDGNTVRVYIDVIAWPKYKVGWVDGALQVGVDAYHMRAADPAAPR